MQNFTLWHQATMEIPRRAHSISACLRHIYMGVVLRVGDVRDPWNTGTEETFKLLPSW